MKQNRTQNWTQRLPAAVAAGWLLMSNPGDVAAAEEPPAFHGAGQCAFLLVDYTLPPAIERAINKVVSKSLQQHEAAFGFTARPEFQVRIRIFGDYKKYEDYTLSHRSGRHISRYFQSITNLSGYYSHATREIVTWRQHHPTYLANNILHEASHAIMFAHYRRMPIWLSEGCATYFAFPRHMQDADDVGSLKFRWAELNIWLRDKTLPQLKTFVNLNQAEWHELKLNMAYTVSWSLFQLLMSTPERKRVLRQFMTEWQQGRRWDLDSAARLEALYPGGLARMEQDWRAWILRGGAKVLGPNLEALLQQARRRQRQSAK